MRLNFQAMYTKNSSVNNLMILLLVLLSAEILELAMVRGSSWYMALFLTVPLLLTALYDKLVKK